MEKNLSRPKKDDLEGSVLYRYLVLLLRKVGCFRNGEGKLLPAQNRHRVFLWVLVNNCQGPTRLKKLNGNAKEYQHYF